MIEIYFCSLYLFLLYLTNCARHTQRILVNKTSKISAYQSITILMNWFMQCLLLFPSLRICLLLALKRTNTTFFYRKNIWYNISNQRQCRTVSSSVRYFTGSCPILRNQGRKMLHYWEGNSTNLGKLIIFKKQTIQIIHRR